ncbi:MAG: DNA/RNA nuclease SfsA [Clostridia bacterium]|nr:DNA/RNA nuclease SfsA [Clostridia bacterium]
MKYNKVVPARFLQRINRFVARVELDGREETVHVKNTGRCKELLVEGATVYLACSDSPSRKTKYDLVTVEKVRKDGSVLSVNIDSQIVNDVAEEWLSEGNLFSPHAKIRREVRYGNSRFDFYVEDGSRKAFLEVKGVTLEQDGFARFPDAPTERGVKHLNELISCMGDGYEAYVLFVLAMEGMHSFAPNDETHKAFGDTLRLAAKQGVKILAVECSVTDDSVRATKAVSIDLKEE